VVLIVDDGVNVDAIVHFSLGLISLCSLFLFCEASDHCSTDLGFARSSETCTLSDFWGLVNVIAVNPDLPSPKKAIDLVLQVFLIMACTGVMISTPLESMVLSP
jgi:hypothetical protein